MSITAKDQSTIIEIIQNALQVQENRSQPTLQDDVLVDTATAGRILHIPASTLVKWRSTGAAQIPFIRINRHIRYKTVDLLAYIQSHTHHKNSLAA